MKMKFVVCDEFPKLAWLAKVYLREDRVEVVHGRYVECGDSFFIEGVWNGDFSAADFVGSNCVFGTGAALQGEAVVFVSPACTTDCLYWRQEDSVVTVSNSLALLLADLDDELAPGFLHYHEINESIAKGIFQYVKAMPTVKGSVNRLIYHNLRVAADGTAEVEKETTPHFSCFQDYCDFLRNNYAAIARNARDPMRGHPLNIYSTQSRGYDTTAINALAKDYGIDKVFTVRQSKGEGAFADRDKGLEGNDDGSEICAELGLESMRIDRRAFERGFSEEYLFCAGLHLMSNANLLDIFRQISGACLLLTGTLGEIWYPKKMQEEHPGSLSDQLVRWDLGLHGLSEVRLKVGFVQLPVPYIGARSRPDIVRITESKEMDPWRLGTNYDRPMPRRIAEEAGVPRHLFGQVKMASATEFPTPNVPNNPELRDEFLAFLVDERLLWRWQLALLPVVHRVNTAIVFRYHHRLVYYFERLIHKIFGWKVHIPLLWRRLNGSLYCCCVNKCVKEYSQWLRSTRSNLQAQATRK